MLIVFKGKGCFVGGRGSMEGKNVIDRRGIVVWVGEVFGGFK